MIRILLDRAFDNERHYIHAVGLSTDAKPTTGIITGSKFVAVDTGAGYLFDETTGEWNENQQLSEAVAAYLDEHPEALDVAAIEAMFGDQLDAIEAEQGVLKSALTLEEKGSTKLSGEAIIQGTYDVSGAVISNDARIRTSGFMPVYKGERIQFTPGINAQQMFYGKYNSAHTFISDGTWITNGALTVDWDGYIILVFRKADNVNITPSEYDATTEFISYFNVATDRLKADTNAIIVGQRTITAFDLIQGSYDRDGAVVANNSVIRTIGFIPVSVGQTISYKRGSNGLRLALGKFDASMEYLGEARILTESGTIITDFNGYVICSFFNASYSAITPLTYDSILTFENHITSSIIIDSIVDDIVQGTFDSNGSVVTSDTVVRTRNFVRVFRDDIVEFKPTGENIKQMLVGYFSEDYAYASESSWYTENAVIAITADGYLILAFKNQDGTALQAAEYDAEVKITRAINKDYAEHKRETEAAYADVYSGKNLIGLDPNVYYPVKIPTGSTLAMSTADGMPLNQDDLVLTFYDEDKNEISSGGWSFPKINAQRTIVVSNGGKTASYVKWNREPARPVQLEFGNCSTRYVPYSAPISNAEVVKRICGATIEKEIISDTFISDYSDADIADIVDAYNAALLGSSGNTEQFLFYTDPHLAYQTGNISGMLPRTEGDINFIQKVYNSSPLSFLLCGGDWLGNRDEPLTAVSKLTYIDGFMRKKFSNYCPMVGNHDTNEQGVSADGQEVGTGVLNVSVLINTVQKYREMQRTYYMVGGPNSHLYVFDTGITGQSVDDYQTEQLKWFAKSLKADNSAHIILALHIFYVNTISSGIIQPITTEILKIAQAYNARNSYTFGNDTYDFAQNTGTVSFLIGGHTHRDVTGNLYDIPFALSMDGTAQGAQEEGLSNERLCTFDMCLADWDNKTLKLKRVGYGSDRQIAIL